MPVCHNIQSLKTAGIAHLVDRLNISRCSVLLILYKKFQIIFLCNHDILIDALYITDFINFLSNLPKSRYFP